MSLQCRPGCGACCISISITSPLPNMPQGKPAGVRCLNLSPLNQCVLWGQASYPAVCRNFQPDAFYCGDNSSQALTRLAQLEKDTLPSFQG